MSRVELIGEDEQGMIRHLNCEKGSGNSQAVVNEANVGFIRCASCGLIYPDEVSQSFEPMEDGLEKEDKPNQGTEGYDPPLWKFDGLEWRMS
jgi:hypothetical protein